MDSLLRQLDAALGGIVTDPRIALALHVLAMYLIAVWLASALWAFVDMRRRSDHLVAPYVSAAAVVLATPILFPLVLLVHVVVRPARLRAERRLEDLRDRAMEAEIDVPTCPACQRRVDPAWLVCPHCRTAIAHLCGQCGRAAPTDWGACGWCGASFTPPARVAPAAR